MEILLLHPGALGDIILSLPAITLLRSQFPSARITIAGNIDHIVPIISGYAERNVALSTLPLHRLYCPEPLPAEDVHFWKSYDRIVSWTGAGDTNFVRKLKQIHPDAIVARWRPQPGENRHVSQLFAHSLGLPHAGIHLDSTTRSAGLQWLAERGWKERDSLIALHPGAGSIEKRWPLSRFVDLAQTIALNEKSRILVLEGPAENGMARQIVEMVPGNKVIPAVSLPLNILAAAMGQCLAFVGNDSGIAHLAAALEVSSVVLFGPTLPQHWAPLGSHVVVLRDARDCEGCNNRGSNHTCLKNITIDQVIRNLKIKKPREAI